MIKLIAMDIDGTLLNGQGRISDRTKQAINALRRQGVEFTLCTGRNLPLARPFAESISITLPMVTCNGAEIRRLNGEILERRPLPFVLTQQVFAILQKYDALFDMYSNDRIVINSRPVHLSRLLTYYRHIRRMDGEFEALLRQEINEPFMFEAQNIGEWLAGEKAAVEKYFVMEHRQDRLNAMFEELRELQEIIVTTSHLTTLEINHFSADKGKALARIAEECGYSPQEVAAVGDGMNDVSMFRYAGVSVAMGNASDAVKQQAAFVTGPNTEDGLAEVLERWGTELNEEKQI